MTLDDFKALAREEINAVFGPDWEGKLVPSLRFKPTTTVNLNPPPLSDEEVRDKFRNDPDLKELISGGIRYARI